jgi:TonB family protein
VLEENIPSVPARSRETIHGRIKVTVRVTIDSSGGVVEDDFVREGPSKYFSRLASESARKWRFKPATGATSRQSLIRFEFTRAGATAHVVTAD